MKQAEKKYYTIDNRVNGWSSAGLTQVTFIRISKEVVKSFLNHVGLESTRNLNGLNSAGVKPIATNGSTQ